MQRKTQSWKDLKRTHILSRSGYSCSCAHSKLLCISHHYSKWTKGRDSNSLWKSSEISLRSALEYRGNQLDNDQKNDSDDDKTQSDNENELDYVHETDENETGFESDHQENEEEDENAEDEKEDEYVRTLSYYSPTDDEDKTNVEDKTEGGEDEEMDYTTSQLYDDVDIRLNKPVQADDETVQKEGTNATPPKKARKFKKPASPKLTTVPVSTEEPTGKLKRVKRPTKKSTQTPARGVVIRETPEMPLSKKKEKVDVSRAESWGNDEDDNNNDQDSSCEDSDQENASDDDKTQSDNDNKSDSKHEKDENESDFESDQEENEEDDEDDEEEEEEEVVKTSSNDYDDEDEAKISDKDEGDGDEEMDYTTSHLYDDVDIRLNELVYTDKGFIQEEGTDAEKITCHKEMKNPKTEVPVTSSSHSSDMAAKFLNFADIPTTEAEIVSPMDVPVHHEVPSGQTPILLTVLVSVITESSPVYTTNIPQSLQSFTPPPLPSTPTPPPTTKAKNPQYALPDFASVFQFNNRVSALEKDVSELKKDDPLKTQVTALILPKEVSNFASLVIQKMVTMSLEEAVLAKESSQPQSSYKAAATLTKFELKKILIDKIDKSESYLAAPEHKECYDGLRKSYDLDKTLFFTYGKVYSLKRSRKDKDKDEDPSAGSDRELKKRKTNKDVEPTKGSKTKESKSSSSKGNKSESKSSGKSVQSEEPEFEVADLDMPQDQEENPGNDDEEPKGKVTSKRDR
ncbi:hypothetical protein Tco_1145907, partial [Tanacetum coccineum]